MQFALGRPPCLVLRPLEPLLLPLDCLLITGSSLRAQPRGPMERRRRHSMFSRESTRSDGTIESRTWKGLPGSLPQIVHGFERQPVVVIAVPATNSSQVPWAFLRAHQTRRSAGCCNGLLAFATHWPLILRGCHSSATVVDCTRWPLATCVVIFFRATAHHQPRVHHSGTAI